MDLQHPPSENGHGVCHTHYPRHHPPQDQHHNIVANPTPISTSWPQSIHVRALQQANLLTRASPNQNPVVGHGQESLSSQQGLTSREPSRSEVDRSEESKAESREDVWSPEEIFNFELAAATAESVEEHVNDVTGNSMGGGLQSAIPTLRRDITGSWPHSANHSLVGACPSQLVEHEVALNAQLGGPSFSTFVSPLEQFETASRNLSSPRHYPIPPTPSPHLHKARRTISRSTFRTPSTSQSYTSAPSAHIPQISQVILPSTVVPSNLTVTPTMTNSIPPVSPSTTPGQDRIVKLDELTAPSQLLQNSASLYGVTPQVSGMGVTRGPGQTDGTGSPSRLLGWTPTNSTSVDVVLGLGSKLDASTRHSGRKRRKLTRRGSPTEISDSDLGLAADSDADNDSDVYQPPGREKGARARRSTAVNGSEALALLTAQKRNADEEYPDNDDEEYSSLSTRKRRNLAIPHPVPVPNLTKKSRGRKVPYVIPSVANRSSQPGSSSNSGGEVGQESEVGEETGERSFVCSECGRCFIRGEHLKRHVRSIHTNDKPYPCPYDGCEKAFSRRDNLSQHVRVHLP